MKLIVGLGNPGKEYENTRHNVGFMAIDNIVDFFRVSLDKKKMNGIFTILNIGAEKVILLKPQSYMNLSGEVVKDFAQYYDIAISDILVISDDMDLEVGKYKLRYKGSSGGHNGLKNIEQQLHTQEYKRIKFGISKDKRMNVKDYVLGRFSSNDLELVRKQLEIMPFLVQDFCTMSFDALMSKYNKK